MTTDSRGMQHVRRLSWQRELVDTYLEAPVSAAYRFARERIVVPLGSSEWHEPEPGAKGRRSCFLSPMFPQFLNLSALDRPVKGAWRG